MAKNPAFQFYPADWLKDSPLQMCSTTTKGVWVQLLCCMWQQPEQGKIAGTVEQFCRLLGCTKAEFDNFVSENNQHDFASVTNCSEIITVINRRMHREYNARKSSKDRTIRYREKKETQLSRSCNANVTRPSSSSSPSPTSSTKNIKKPPTPLAGVAFDIPKNLDTPEFRLIWTEWQQHLKEKKKSLKPTSAKRQLGTLKKHPVETAIAMVARSIEKNWTGIFELPQGNSNGRTTISTGGITGQSQGNQTQTTRNNRPSLEEQDWGGKLIPT